jgi:phosphatidylserine decarboxylase
MRLHREGRVTLFYFAGILCSIVLALIFFVGFTISTSIFLVLIAILYIFLLNFFRNPQRPITQKNDSLIYSPCDGKVVAIEEITEDEYFKDRRIQVSIFMSPLNVHVNRIPVSGKIAYQKYHAGKYLVAWHPKSSTENERNTVVIDQGQYEVLVRQIAGALARRISCYAQQGEQFQQGEELGFIKFGSRVDVFLPLDTKIKVQIDQHVRGNIDVLAEVPQ